MFWGLEEKKARSEFDAATFVYLTTVEDFQRCLRGEKKVNLFTQYRLTTLLFDDCYYIISSVFNSNLQRVKKNY